MPQLMTDWNAMEQRLLKKHAALVDRIGKLNEERQAVADELERVRTAMRPIARPAKAEAVR